MKHILIPIDGSDCAEKTMDWAIETFDKLQTRYSLLYVVRVLPELPNEAYEVENAVDILKTGEEKMKQAGCHVVQAEYVLGDPRDMICSYAEAEDIDEVLIGSHGRSGLAKILMGSVSTGVLEHCQKPVFVYRNVEKKAKAKPVQKSKAML